MTGNNSIKEKLLVVGDIAACLFILHMLTYTSSSFIYNSCITAMFVVLLYIADLYRFRRVILIKYLVLSAFVVVCFDISYVMLRFFYDLEPNTNRRELLYADIYLVIYLTFRYVFVKVFSDNIIHNIYYIRNENHDDPVFPLFNDLPAKRFWFGGNCSYENGVFIDSAGGRPEDDSVFIISKIDGYSAGMQQILLEMKIKGFKVFTYEDFCEIFLEKIPIESISDEWLIISRGFENIFQRSYIRIKRLFDIFISLFGLITASPILLLAAIAIKTDSRGPVFFSQIRSGHKGKTFIIFKLRTMTKDAEKKGAQWAQSNDCRITKVGNFLRKTRIDEIPQLYNVLKGDMSFIGPRPERPEFDQVLAEQVPYYRMRYVVKPGLTGWAQVNFGYVASIDDTKHKLMYDLYYIKNYSMMLDCRIILKTIHIVLFGKGR